MKLSYLNKNGDTVFTSKYYVYRGTCCKSACLHCPYGYTLKEIGIKITEIDDDNFHEAKELYEKFHPTDSVTSSLLDSASGKKKVIAFRVEDFKVLTLKGFFCGILQMKNEVYINHFLKDEFSDQGITKDYFLAMN